MWNEPERGLPAGMQSKSYFVCFSHDAHMDGFLFYESVLVYL